MSLRFLELFDFNLICSTKSIFLGGVGRWLIGGKTRDFTIFDALVAVEAAVEAAAVVEEAVAAGETVEAAVEGALFAS